MSKQWVATVLIACAGVVGLTPAARAQVPYFTAGEVEVKGFPGPTVNDPPVITPQQRSGGGQTGGGFGGDASIDVSIGTSGFNAFYFLVTGSADHLLDSGYTGAGPQNFLAFTVPVDVTFSIVNSSRFRLNGQWQPFTPARITAVTRSIEGDPKVAGTLWAGTYRLDVGILAGFSSDFGFFDLASFYPGVPTSPTQFISESIAEWGLSLRIISDCPEDLNGDGTVDDVDFVLFAASYNLVACDDPGMPAGCPADFSGDFLVDDFDFVLFAQAYDRFVCP